MTPHSDSSPFRFFPGESGASLPYTALGGQNLTSWVGKAEKPLLRSVGLLVLAQSSADRGGLSRGVRVKVVDERGETVQMREPFSNRPTTVADYSAILRRRKWIVLVPPVAAAIAAYVLSMGQSPMYRASADVLVNRASVVSAITGVDPSGGDPIRYLATQASIARDPVLAKRVSDASRIPGMTPDRVLSESQVTPSTDSDTISISVEDGDQAAAARLANTYAAQFTEFTKERATASVDDTLTSLQARLKSLAAHGQSDSTLYAALLQQQGQLATVGKLMAGIASVLQPAEGAAKTRPRPKRNAILGFLFGGVVGVALAFLAEALDRRVRDEHEIDAFLGLPLLARVPAPSRALQKSNDLVMLREPSGAQAETFRKLRTSIEFVNPEGAARTIMVTSAMEQEGKSTTIANLAVALAKGGRRVALVDLDLRRPYLSRLFHVGGRPGITDVSLKKSTLTDAPPPSAVTTRIHELA